MNDIRIFFEKKSLAKYISHLDLMRLFSRAFKRANLPIWFTEGFNPHIYMTFSLPLSLGIESDYEALDTRISDEISFEEVKTKLNEILPTGIKVIKVAEQIKKPKEIVKAEYEVIINGNLIEKFNEFLSLPEILVEKRTKKGMSTVDIKPEITVLSKEQNENLILRIILPAGCTKNINPNLVTSAFFEMMKIEDRVADIKRVDILCENDERFL